jgi:diguanylate cyclase (GGDEF)-like protein
VDRERVAQNHQRRLQGMLFPNRYDISIVTKGGEKREAELTASNLGSGEDPGVLVVLVDITERKRSEAQLQHYALHDALTGLANRVLFFDRVNTAVAAAQRKGNAFALLYLDLDDFKPINDTYGHEAGDLALQTVAERLSDCVRESDTVARLGGDEFVVLVHDTLDESAANTVAEKIIAVIAQPLPLEGCSHRIGCSIGIALYPHHGTDADSVMRQADAAMYGAKRLGKNRYLMTK